MKAHLWLLGAALPGCFSPSGLTDEMPDDLPAGHCADTDTDACVSSTGGAPSTSTGDGSSSSAAAPVDGCEASDACVGNAACVAVWNADEGARGPFECRFACVPVLDEAAWCRDDASCCDAGATCTARGYCVVVDVEGRPSGTAG